MRISKGWIEPYEARSRSKSGKAAKSSSAYRVRWRVYLPDGSVRNPKQGGFERKGNAAVFVENLARAELGIDGWKFDARFHPVRVAPVEVVAPALGPTVLELVAKFVRLKWSPHWKSENTRGRQRGRLLVFVASLLVDPDAAERLVAALAAQAPNRHSSRPEPDTTEDWAARYLHAHVLFKKDEPGDGELEPELLAARDWLRSQSLPASLVDDDRLLFARRFLTDGRPDITARTYWASVKSFLKWAVISENLERNPAAGMPDFPRDIEGEEVDPEAVPSEAEV